MEPKETLTAEDKLIEKRENIARGYHVAAGIFGFSVLYQIWNMAVADVSPGRIVNSLFVFVMGFFCWLQARFLDDYDPRALALGAVLSLTALALTFLSLLAGGSILALIGLAQVVWHFIKLRTLLKQDDALHVS